MTDPPAPSRTRRRATFLGAVVAVLALGLAVHAARAPRFDERALPSMVNALAFTPDGRLLLAGDERGMLTIWGVEGERLSREPVAALGGHAGTIHALAVAPDGRQAATASADRTVRVWDLAQRNTTVVLDASSLAPVGSGLIGVALGRDGKRCVAAVENGPLVAWALDAPRAPALVQEALGETWAPGVAFSADGSECVRWSRPGGIFVWHDGQERTSTPLPCGPASGLVSLDRAGRMALVAAAGLGSLYDLETGSPAFADVVLVGHPHDSVSAIALAVDGTFFAVGVNCMDQRIELRATAAPREPLAAIHLGRRPAEAHALSPDGSLVAVSSGRFMGEGETPTWLRLYGTVRR